MHIYVTHVCSISLIVSEIIKRKDLHANLYIKQSA